MKTLTLAFATLALCAFLPDTTFAAEAGVLKDPSSKSSSTAEAADAADPPVQDDTATPDANEPERRHVGFYISVDLGFGYGSFGTTLGGQELDVHGFGPAGSLQCGGMIAENLALVGDIRVLSVRNPTITFDGLSVDTEDSNATLVGIGPGIVYYVMPADVSVGASLLMTQLSIGENDSDDVSETERGVGVSLRVGKEWALRKGGLGVVGGFGLSTMKAKNSDYRWTGTALSLSAAYTYN